MTFFNLQKLDQFAKGDWHFWLFDTSAVTARFTKQGQGISFQVFFKKPFLSSYSQRLMKWGK